MLDTAGKVLENIIRLRLQSAIQAAGGLSNREHGFKAGFSTVDAVRTVTIIAEQAQQGNHYSRKICVAATLDVRNAFNSLRWEDALNTLRDRFGVPGYLQWDIYNYGIPDKLVVALCFVNLESCVLKIFSVWER